MPLGSTNGAICPRLLRSFTNVVVRGLPGLSSGSSLGFRGPQAMFDIPARNRALVAAHRGRLAALRILIYPVQRTLRIQPRAIVNEDASRSPSLDSGGANAIGPRDRNAGRKANTIVNNHSDMFAFRALTLARIGERRDRAGAPLKVSSCLSHAVRNILRVRQHRRSKLRGGVIPEPRGNGRRDFGRISRSARWRAPRQSA